MGATGSQGPQGPAGANGLSGTPGAQGPQGVAGPQGPAGPTGAAGPVGMTFSGNFDPTTSYAVNTVVYWQGSSYISTSAVPAGLTGVGGPITPDQVSPYWGQLAMMGAIGPPGLNGESIQGPTGPPGLTGMTGPQGIPGIPGVVGSQGPMGPAGPVGPAGSAGTTGPAGSAGPAGATGSQGPQGNTGSQGAAGSQGPAGPQGPAGAPGSAITSLSELNGIACSNGGTDGTTRLSVALSGVVAITCQVTPPASPLDVGTLHCGGRYDDSGTLPLNVPADIWLSVTFNCVGQFANAGVQMSNGDPALRIDLIANSPGYPLIFVGNQFGTTIPESSAYFVHLYGTPTATSGYDLTISD